MIHGLYLGSVLSCKSHLMIGLVDCFSASTLSYTLLDLLCIHICFGSNLYDTPSIGSILTHHGVSMRTRGVSVRYQGHHNPGTPTVANQLRKEGAREVKVTLLFSNIKINIETQN